MEKVIIKKGKQETSLTKAEVKRMIKSSVNQIMEPKSFDQGLFIAPGNGSGAYIGCQSVIPQGDTDTTRDGDQLTISFIETRYSCLVNATDVSNVLRVILFLWHFDNGEYAPAASDIVQLNTTPYSSYNRDSVKQRAFTVLHDGLHGVYSGGPGIVCKYLKIKNKSKITFRSGGTTGKNHLYYLVISDSSVSPFPTFAAYTRVQFLDA